MNPTPGHKEIGTRNYWFERYHEDGEVSAYFREEPSQLVQEDLVRYGFSRLTGIFHAVPPSRVCPVASRGWRKPPSKNGWIVAEYLHRVWQEAERAEAAGEPPDPAADVAVSDEEKEALDAEERPIFYRQVLQVTILSEKPIGDMSLDEVNAFITEGDGVGRVETIANEPVASSAMVRLLRECGSEPGFFQLDEKGNPL